MGREGGVPVYTVSTMRDTSGAAPTRGRPCGAEAAVDVELAPADRVAARHERKQEIRRAQAHVHLPTVCVAAELQRDLARGCREDLRVVAEQDAGQIARLGHGGEGAADVEAPAIADRSSAP